MLMIIKAVCQNPSVLIEVASVLTETIEAEDLVNRHLEVVSGVGKSLVAIGTEIMNLAKATLLLAERITTIAIQLHRQEAYREIGLKIFEDLLSLNLRETKSALETLDRRVVKVNY